MAKANATQNGTAENTDELQKYTGFSTEELKGLNSFEDVEKLFASRGETVVSASEELGDGFALLNNKAVLEGRPMFLISWAFSKGDFSEEFVSVRVMCHMDGGAIGKFVINDGGTGIRKQLREWSDSNGGRAGGMFVNKGLRRSEYDYTDEKGNTSKAETWYLDTSA